MEPVYTAVATASGGRDGRTRSDDGRVDVRLSVPEAMGGPGGEGTNPEQLFAAGYASCFHSAVKLVAARRELDAQDSTVTARVGLGANEKGRLVLGVGLTVKLPRVASEKAEALVATAHKVCPYSNAIRDNVDVELSVE